MLEDMKNIKRQMNKLHETIKQMTLDTDIEIQFDCDIII
jgi:hypothetical protein